MKSRTGPRTGNEVGIAVVVFVRMRFEIVFAERCGLCCYVLMNTHTYNVLVLLL